VTGSDPEVTLFHRKSPGSGCRRWKTRVLGTFELLHVCNSQEVAVTCEEKTSRGLTWPEVIRKWRHLSGRHLEVAVEGLQVWFWVRLSSNRAVTRRSWQPRDSKWRHVTSRDRKWPARDVTWAEVTWKWLQKAYKSGFGYVWAPTGL